MVPVIVIGLVFSSFPGIEAVVIQISNQDTSTGSSSDDTTIDFTIEVNEPSTVDFPNGVDSETLPSNLIIRIIVDPDTINEIVALYDINGNSLDDTDPQIISNIIFNGIESSSSNDGALGYGNFYGYSYGFGQLGDGTNVYGLTSTGFGEDKIGLYTINLDTVSLSDGQHGLRIDVLDKSDDTEFFSSGAITITNVDIAPDTAPTPLISTTTSPTFLELIPFTVNFGEEIKIIQLAAATSHTSDTDSTSPIPIINTTAADPTNLEPIPFTVNFGENMTSGEFVAAEITLSSGTVTDFTPDSANQLFAFNATDADDNANLTVDVAANVATDLASNNNTAANQLSVAVDRTAPTLNSVVILSSNTNSTLAANGDTVTLSFTASESIADVEVAIANVAATVSGSGTSWDATRTLDGTEPEGALSFTINFDDPAGNSGVQVSATTDSSAVTTDFTAPTLNSVVILSSNTDSTLAANGDTVTLSFTASESIADVEVAIANVAATVSGSGTSWDATRTLDGTEPEGALSFTINFDDPAGNSGVQVSATTDSSAVTTDFTAPTLNSVVILSSNTDSTLAANGDTVTLSFTASESIADVEVAIANVAATVSGSGTSWDATRTLDGTEPEGALSFTINFDDPAGNSGVQVSATTDSSAVTTDFTAPTLQNVTISSSNTNSTLAANGDTVTLSFTASESIADVEVAIANVAATVSGSGTSWDATRTLDGTEPEGALSFTINFDDPAGNSGVQVSATTDSSAVTTDFTVPTLQNVTISSSNTDSTLAANGDTVTLSFTASESIADVEVTIANVAATVSGSGTSWDATRTLDGTEPEEALSFTINFDDLTGNSGVQVSATTDSSAVTTDFTAPTLNSVVILSSNTNSTLAANGDTVTLSFTASESIADVEVAIANVAATVSGSGTSWDATRTLDGTEPEGALSFTINFDDLTGNSGVQVSATTDSSAVTTDFTAPTLQNVTISSSNTDSTLAANGDTVTLSFTASESIADVEVAIANVAATVSGSGTSWDATRTLDGTEPEGALSFTINFDDLTGNSGVQVSATTDSSAVTTDFTAPTLNSVVILSSNTNSTLAANGDTVTLSFTASESIADVEVAIANVAATVSGSGTSWDATRTLDGTEPEGALSFTINFDDLTGNSGVQVSATTDSSAVTTDFTVPTLQNVTISSSNTDSTLAANGDTVTLSFTASESIADVEVAIANVAATVSGSGTSWDATRTLDGTEPEGALSFTINFDDLTGNSGVQVSATTDSSAVTTDFTAPTLNSVVILSSNTNSTLAANGDTVTLSFTASESIADVEVAIANVAATVSGSGTSWDATRTLDGTEPEGALSFTINFDDLTGNSGVQVSATTDSSAVTTDFTAPTLQNVTISSSNTNSTLAANGDTVTLSFTASESIADVEVAIANVAATVSGSGTSWDATRTLDGTEPEGALSFTINFDDLTGNSGVQVSATTDSSAVTTDFTAPTLNSVVILSSNTNSTLAANGDTVTLSFTASESIADVEVAIANVAATVSGSGTSWDATRTLDGTEPEGALSFTINFDDLTGNSGVQVSATTDSSAVTTDFTAPTLQNVTISSSNTDSTLAANGDTVTLSFTASESIADVEVAIANVAATVSGSGTSWDATRTLDGTEPEGALSFTINFDDLTGNSGVQVSATTDSSAVTTDFTAPTLNSVVILSSNTNSTLAANGDTVTLSFTASESIADVEVAIANVAATVSGSGTSWDATRTLDGTEPEGALSFTINFDDLTGNSGVQVSATTDSSAVTTDFTVPTLQNVTISSSNTNSTLAANGDTVTLSFTASESIADVEVAIANVAATVSGSGTSWDATRTLDGTEPEGALSFTINFDDLTGNSGVQVSATTDSSAVTTDFTAPTLNSVVILSSNTNSTLAANGDTVTLSFTASESIADVEVAIANVAATVSGSGTSWDATRTLDGTEPEGALSFTINFDDLTGNSGVQVSATTDSSAVTTDFTVPTLQNVTISSSNTNSTLAANGDTVTLSFTASESIADVEVAIANVAATVSGSGTSWDATRTLDGTEPEGALSFTINFDDLTGNSGVQVSATTDSSAVTTDFTAPTLNSVVILSSNTNSTLAANGDTVTLSFTASESIADVEVAIANVAATVSGSGTSWDATRTLDGTEPEGALSFTINFDDLTGNSGVQVSATTDSSAVTTDFTAPTLNSVVISSSNTNSTLAANGDTVTLSFTASESIADVEVAIANVAATVSGSGTSWDATRTLDGTEPEGALSFTINFDDLTGNSGVQVSATTDSSAVTTDFTAPTLNSVVILSSNTNSTLAANGDTVTLSFTASESIADVEVAIANVAATVSGSGTSWDATRTLDGTEPEGALSFTINFDDLTGNSGVQVSATTDSSAVTTDFTAPTLQNVTISSSNTNSTLAANGDTVTLSFTASESIADVEVAIANVAATVSGSGTSWDATRTLDGTEPEGALSFTINFDDLTGNSGVQVSATTDSSVVTSTSAIDSDAVKDSVTVSPLAASVLLVLLDNITTELSVGAVKSVVTALLSVVALTCTPEFPVRSSKFIVNDNAPSGSVPSSVLVASQLVPLPDTVAATLAIVTSTSAIDSDAVKDSVTVSPLAASVLLVLLDNITTELSVGAVKSVVTALLSVVALTCTPEFPVRSSKFIVNDNAPSGSVPSSVLVASQLVPLPDTVAATLAIATSTSAIDSDAVKDSVTVSPLAASVLLVLLDNITTELSVGAVKSVVTALLSVVALTCTPEFPVRSSKFIVNDNAPSGSVPSSVLVASQLVPLPDTVAATLAIVTSTSAIDSDAVKDSVTVSPLAASVLLVLLDNITTELSVGAVKSVVTALLSVVALTCTPEFPVRSSKFIVNDNAPSGSVPSSVLVASQLVPLPDTVAATLAIVTSTSAIDSDAVKDSVTVSPLAASVLLVLLDNITTELSVGAVKSVVTALLSVVALTCTPEFPVRSSKFIVNDNAPSGSVPSSVLVASQLVPLPDTVAATLAIVTSTSAIDSDAVKDSVTVSPLAASVLSGVARQYYNRVECWCSKVGGDCAAVSCGADLHS